MKYVLYYRVSTKGQEVSGLGLAAQERDVNLYLEQYAEPNHQVIAEFTETASGSNDDRTEFLAALDYCKKRNATLLVAKLDRISRKVSTIAKLIEEVDFKVASLPNADKMQLHIHAVMAEMELDFISARTKAALKEAKARGVVLGGNRGNIDKANKANTAKANKEAESYRAHLETIIASGKNTYKAIAEKMNELEVKTARGGTWQATQIKRMIVRLGLEFQI